MTTIKQTGRLAAAPPLPMDPERSSLRRLGNGLLIRAQEVQLLPGPATPPHTRLAQSVERRPLKSEVRGSSPRSCPNRIGLLRIC
jgi:hypothetical protein